MRYLSILIRLAFGGSLLATTAHALAVSPKAAASSGPVDGSRPNPWPHLPADQGIIIEAVDEQGEPAPGARIGAWARGDVRESASQWSFRGRVAVTDRNGQAFFPAEALFVTGAGKQLEARPLYALFEPASLTGVAEVSLKDRGRRVQLALHPGCRVKGLVTSTEMRQIGRSLDLTWVYLQWQGYRLLEVSGGRTDPRGFFEFLLPPGDYVLNCNGGQVDGMQAEPALLPITITPGERAKSVTVDLPLSPLARLTGSPAPDLQQIKAYKNGGPVKLSDLKGKVILLDFWGYWCGPCIREMPKLMELHDKYADKGLVMIAIHDDSVDSISQMDALLQRPRETLWKGRDLPFLVALDGGGEIPIKGTDQKAKGATTAAYGIEHFPTTVLIDRGGTVVGTFNAYAKEHVIRLQRMLGVVGADARKEHSAAEAAEKRRSDTGWKERFSELYRLNQAEVLRLIPAPFIPERDRFLFHQEPLAVESPRSMLVPWDGQPEYLADWMDGSSLKHVLVALGLTPEHQFTGPEKLLELEIPGDWVVRPGADPPQLLAALERILHDRLNRRIHFQRRSVEKDVILVSGTYQFHPLAGIAAYDIDAIQVMANRPNPDNSGGGGNAPRWIFRVLGSDRYVDRFFLVEADLPWRTRQNWALHDSCRLQRYSRIDFDRGLNLLLSNLDAQTSLRFEKQRRRIDLWTVTEAIGE